MVRLITAKELRNDEELAPKCDSTTVGESFQVDGPEWHTAERVNTYLIDCIKGYEMYGRIDEELWEMYQEDFKGWTEQLFALGHKTIRTTLRDLLRDNSINVGGTRYVSQQLFNILQEGRYTEWPKEEIEKQLKTGRGFNSYQNPFVRAEREANSAMKHQEQPTQASYQQRPTAPTNATASGPISFSPASHEQTGATGPALPYRTATPTQGLTTKALTNLELLVDKLQKIQRGLSADYQGDYNLRDQLVNACQGVPACRIVLLRPSATFESVASDLRNAIGIEMRCQNPAPRQYYADGGGGGYNEEGTNEQFWVDRRYEGRGGYRGQRPHGREREWGGYGSGNDRNKKCFVCGKVRRWSTKHPAQERRQRQGKWRWYARERGQGTPAPDFAASLTDFEAWCATDDKG